MNKIQDHRVTLMCGIRDIETLPACPTGRSFWRGWKRNTTTKFIVIENIYEHN